MPESTDFIYWPDTNHPSLDREAASIRALMADNRWHINVAKQSKPLFVGYEPQPIADDPFKVETLTVRKAVGPAPYVGTPFVYMWKVAVGAGNRWVAGPAEIKYLPIGTAG